jgi:hypothetical protein
MALLDRVVEKLDSDRTQATRTGVDGYIYLLSGILVSEDGSKFTGQPGKNRQYRYYYNESKKLRLGCKEVDDLVRKAVKEHLVSPEGYQKLVKDGFARLQKMVPEIEARIQDLQKRLEALSRDERKMTASFSAGKLEDATYSNWLKRQIQEISQERVKAEQELAFLRDQKDAFLTHRGLAGARDNVKAYLDDGFERLTPVMQRTLIEKVVSSVVVTSDFELEIRVGSPLLGLVTSSEERSTDKIRSGGRDGT